MPLTHSHNPKSQDDPRRRWFLALVVVFVLSLGFFVLCAGEAWAKEPPAKEQQGGEEGLKGPVSGADKDNGGAGPASVREPAESIGDKEPAGSKRAPVDRPPIQTPPPKTPPGGGAEPSEEETAPPPVSTIPAPEETAPPRGATTAPQPTQTPPQVDTEPATPRVDNEPTTPPMNVAEPTAPPPPSHAAQEPTGQTQMVSEASEPRGGPEIPGGSSAGASPPPPGDADPLVTPLPSSGVPTSAATASLRELPGPVSNATPSVPSAPAADRNDGASALGSTFSVSEPWRLVASLGTTAASDPVRSLQNTLGTLVGNFFALGSPETPSSGTQSPSGSALPHPLPPLLPIIGGGSSIALLLDGGLVAGVGGGGPLLLLMLFCALATGLVVLSRRDGTLWLNLCEMPKPSSALLLPLERPG